MDDQPLTASEVIEVLRGLPADAPVAITYGDGSRLGVVMIVHDEPTRIAGRDFVLMEAG